MINKQRAAHLTFNTAKRFKRDISKENDIVLCEQCGEVIGLQNLTTRQVLYEGNFCKMCGKRIQKVI